MICVNISHNYYVFFSNTSFFVVYKVKINIATKKTKGGNMPQGFFTYYPKKCYITILTRNIFY